MRSKGFDVQQREQQETETHEAQHAHDAARETRRQVAAERRDCERPGRQDPAHSSSDPSCAPQSAATR